MGSLAVNVGSLNNNQRGGSSDTEGDFLDKSFDTKKGILERANQHSSLEEDNEYKSNMADDENSVCGSDIGPVRDKKSVKVDKSSALPSILLKTQSYNFIITGLQPEHSQTFSTLLNL